MRRSTGSSVLVYSSAVIAVVVAMAPIAFLIYASIVPAVELLRQPLEWIPREIDLSRYAQIFTDDGGQATTFLFAMINSLVVGLVAVAISMAVGIFGAYAFARLRFKFRGGLMLLFLLTYMLPPISILVPLYLLEASLGLLDTQFGLVLVYVSFITPFVLWVMGNFFQSIPVELEEQAQIDGLGRIGVLFRVVLPLSRAGLLSTALLGFLLAWDEFLYALIFTNTDAAKTIPVAIAEFTGRNAVDFGLIATGGVLACIPPVVIAVIFQRYIVGGLTAGALKG
jgi:multiple sugar transport system permease protein